jgi:large subunit ribosomal protein L4
MKINVLDLKGKNIETIDLNPKKEGSIDNVLRYIRVFFSNQRQGTSSTKTRREVSGGGKKPWKQKGTGRARAGSTRSPLWVGGGVSHGPKPKSWRLSLPKTVKSEAFAVVVKNYANNENLMVVDFSDLKKASTKSAQTFMSEASLNDQKVLLVHQNNEIVSKSFRNLRNTTVIDIKSLNTFDIVSASKVVFDKESLEVLKEKIK